MKSILSQTRCDNGISPLLPNRAAAICSKIEEYDQLHSQLLMVEDQISSLFEADLQKIKSLEELELCEKHLEKTLATVKERQKHLMTNHLSSCKSPCLQEISNSVENEVANWSHNHADGFDSSSSSVLVWDNVSALCDPLSQGSSSNIGGFPAKTPSDEYLSTWPHVHPSTDLGDQYTQMAPP